MDTDITDRVKFDENDADSLPLTQCVCGAQFVAWDFLLNTDRGLAKSCRACGRKMYFRCSIQVFEVNDQPRYHVKSGAGYVLWSDGAYLEMTCDVREAGTFCHADAEIYAKRLEANGFTTELVLVRGTSR